MKGRPNADTIGPRFVCDRILEAETALELAHKATEDKTVEQAIAKARQALGPAVARARLILKDVDLKTAEQPDLMLDTDPRNGG